MSEFISYPRDRSKYGLEPMGEARPIRDDDRIPPGYSLFQGQVRLVNGNVEPAFYSTREGQTPDPEAWNRSSESVITGFRWALTVPEFRDNETEDDDRTQEIGNMMSYAISQGLTEEQIVACYELAFDLSRQQDL